MAQKKLVGKTENMEFVESVVVVVIMLEKLLLSKYYSHLLEFTHSFIYKKITRR